MTLQLMDTKTRKNNNYLSKTRRNRKGAVVLWPTNKNIDMFS